MEQAIPSLWTVVASSLSECGVSEFADETDQETDTFEFLISSCCNLFPENPTLENYQSGFSNEV